MTQKILIVDDNEKNLKLCRVLLGSAGYATIEAADGAQALVLAAAEPPDLILMDIQMPVMDGTDALKALRGGDRTKDIPVVALTSYAMKGDRERFIEAGFAAYVPKPIEAKSFLRTVGEVLEGRSSRFTFTIPLRPGPVNGER